MKWWQHGIGKWVAGDVVALDEAGNALFLDGNAHETISAHCGAQIEAATFPAHKAPCKFCSFICKLLGKRWPNHCVNSWHDERTAVLSTQNLPGGGA